MCGRYFCRSDKQRIAEAFHLGVFEDLPLEVAPSYNIAPTIVQPVIRNSGLRRERERVKRGGNDKTTNLPVSACYDWAAFCRDWGCAWAILEVSAKVECMFL